jgi:hypothetical protein
VSTKGNPAFLDTQTSTFSGQPGSITFYILVTVDGADVFAVEASATLNNTQPTPSPAAASKYMIGKVSALR